MPSVSFTLNVPGFPKSYTITKKFFNICLKDLLFFLQANRIQVNKEDSIRQTDMAGDFFMAPLSDANVSVTDIKQICETFEERHPFGRFVDVDVTDSLGNPVSSGKAKLCFFCHQKPAAVCRHENNHDLNELRQFMFSKMEEFCQHHLEREICRKLSSLALKAVLYEISLTPKPGLVDKFSNGSHADMNFQTFIDSTAAVSPYFSDLVHEGFNFHEKDLSRALPIIRNIGLQMETAMFANTQNVNTQKGLIFLMGLSLFASGYLFATQSRFETDRFREILKQICRDITCKELENSNRKERTHGEEMYSRYAVSGARGEAEEGFPMVFDFGLPELLKYGVLNDEVLQKAFLLIAAHNNDTNIIYRGDLEVLENFKTLSAHAASQNNTESYNQLMNYCAKENISPGGSADLLAVTIYIYSLIQSGDEIEVLQLSKTDL